MSKPNYKQRFNNMLKYLDKNNAWVADVTGNSKQAVYKATSEKGREFCRNMKLSVEVFEEMKRRIKLNP